MFKFLAKSTHQSGTLDCRREFTRHLLHRITTLAISACTALFSQTLYTPSLKAESNERPNIVLIVGDDLGYGELGCYGGSDIPTPNLDALASQGVRFTDGYVTAPYCAASRAGMIAGRYQTRFGFEFNPVGAKNNDPAIGLPTSETTIAEHLRGVGYATSLVGKWHLGGTPAFHPQRHGFDEFFGFLHEGHFYVPPPWNGVTTWLRRTALPSGGKGLWTSPDRRIIWSTQLGHNEPPYDADNPVMRSSQPVDECENLTDAFTREACHFIERKQEQPFFLYLAYNAVHSPLQGEDKYMDRFSHIDNVQRRLFAAMLSHLDDCVGRVIDSLKQHDLQDNTLVIFLSDNGGPTAELTSSNAPLRDGKGSLYEGGVRVPMIVSWKDQVQPGPSDSIASSLDLTATALTAAGVKNKLNQLDGVDLMPLLSGRAQPTARETLYWRLGEKHAMRHKKWKLIRTGDRPWELYDLSVDVGESHDLACGRVDVVQQLSKMWHDWSQLQSEPLWR